MGPGIYEVQNGEFKLCVGEKDRPKALLSKAGTDSTLFIFKREKR